MNYLNEVRVLLFELNSILTESVNKRLRLNIKRDYGRIKDIVKKFNKMDRKLFNKNISDIRKFVKSDTRLLDKFESLIDDFNDLQNELKNDVKIFIKRINQLSNKYKTIETIAWTVDKISDIAAGLLSSVLFTFLIIASNEHDDDEQIVEGIFSKKEKKFNKDWVLNIESFKNIYIASFGKFFEYVDSLIHNTIKLIDTSEDIDDEEAENIKKELLTRIKNIKKDYKKLSQALNSIVKFVKDIKSIKKESVDEAFNSSQRSSIGKIVKKGQKYHLYTMEFGYDRLHGSYKTLNAAKKAAKNKNIDVENNMYELVDGKMIVLKK